MNNKYSKMFLVTVIIGIILLGFGIILTNKEEIVFEDINGDRNELGDMIITYQKTKGFFQTNEINISKDKIYSKSFVKEGADGFELSEDNLENREILKYISSKSEICEDENEVATVSLVHTYLTEDNSEMTACIEVKNKKTEDIKYYEIPIDNRIDTSGNTDYLAIPIKDKDNIYITILSSIYDEESKREYKQEEYRYNFEETYLSLYKINLSNQTSKLVLSDSYDGKFVYVVSRFGFSKGDVSYFIINKKQGDEYKNILFGFDVKTKKISYLDLGNSKEVFDKYELNENKLMLYCSLINQKEVIKIRLIDLNENKIIRKNEINIEKDNNENIVTMKRENGKFYLIVDDKKTQGSYYKDDNRNTVYYIYVIDEKTDEVLYKGRLLEKSVYNIKFGIRKN